MTTGTKAVKEITLTDYEFKKGMLGSQVVLKLPCMRKPDEFEIYNFTKDSKYIEFQGDNKCFIFRLDTGIIEYSNKGNMPIIYYAHFKTTHLFKVTNNVQFIEEVTKFVKSDSRNKEDGSTEVLLFGT